LRKTLALFARKKSSQRKAVSRKERKGKRKAREENKIIFIELIVHPMEINSDRHE
jgi:hypothetical protein